MKNHAASYWPSMHIFTMLPDRFAKDPKADIEDLLPWNQKIMEICKLGV